MNSLYSYQTVIVDNLAALAQLSNRPTVSLPHGSGKSGAVQRAASDHTNNGGRVVVHVRGMLFVVSKKKTDER